MKKGDSLYLRHMLDAITKIEERSEIDILKNRADLASCLRRSA